MCKRNHIAETGLLEFCLVELEKPVNPKIVVGNSDFSDVITSVKFQSLSASMTADGGDHSTQQILRNCGGYQ